MVLAFLFFLLTAHANQMAQMMRHLNHLRKQMEKVIKQDYRLRCLAAKYCIFDQAPEWSYANEVTWRTCFHDIGGFPLKRCFGKEVDGQFFYSNCNGFGKRDDDTLDCDPDDSSKFHGSPIKSGDQHASYGSSHYPGKEYPAYDWRDVGKAAGFLSLAERTSDRLSIEKRRQVIRYLQAAKDGKCGKMCRCKSQGPVEGERRDVVPGSNWKQERYCINTLGIKEDEYHAWFQCHGRGKSCRVDGTYHSGPPFNEIRNMSPSGRGWSRRRLNVLEGSQGKNSTREKSRRRLEFLEGMMQD